ncbi:unnamed protein product [Adineta steineri]|uniref:Phytanoyl-CoA dioxygenase n=2 Tax=Adineta steineri TaxID=433720 RepID=A0A819IXP8_9BILA|nr:unnamed protein product [Adineta steineri]
MTVNERVNLIVTNSLINEYKENGAVCIRQLLNKNEVELLRQGIDENLLHPSPHFGIASQPDHTGRFIEDFCTWQTNRYYKQFIYESPCAVIAGHLMKSSISRLYHDHLLIKESNTKQITQWHQDQPYYNIEGNQTCCFWIPIDSVSRYSTLEFIGGSHCGQRWLMPRAFMNSEAKWFPEEPGDVIAFHMLTLHGSQGTRENDNRRRVFSVRFLGDDVIHAPRTWITSPDFSYISQHIKPGAPMDHPDFPIIWKSL